MCEDEETEDAFTYQDLAVAPTEEDDHAYAEEEWGDDMEQVYSQYLDA